MPSLRGYPFNYTFATHHHNLRWLAFNMVPHSLLSRAGTTLGWRRPSADLTVRNTASGLLSSCFWQHVLHKNVGVDSQNVCLSHLLRRDERGCLSGKWASLVPEFWSLLFFKKKKTWKFWILSSYTYSDLGVLLASSEGHREPLWV